MSFNIRKDTLWKGILGDFVEEFIQFFFPELVPQINWSKPIIPLDKELKQLHVLSKSKERFADRLFRVSLKDNTERWILIHVEAQGYQDKNFAKRMFQTFYRLFDRHQQPVISLVIYTNTNRESHYSHYFYKDYGMELSYRFQTFVLLDHTPGQLRQSENVFAIILEAAWQDLHSDKKTDKERLREKVLIARKILNLKKYPKYKIQYLLDFVKFYVRFNERESFTKFDQLTEENRKNMSIREAIMQEIKEKGLQQGIEQGIEQGREQGREQGIEQGKREAITGVVKNLYFRGMQASEIAEIINMELTQVEAILQKILEENSAQA